MFKNLLAKLKSLLVPARKKLDKQVDTLLVEAEKLAEKADEKLDEVVAEVQEEVEKAVKEAVKKTAKKTTKPKAPKAD